MPWEYFEQMRPWIQVYFLEGIRKVLILFGVDNAYSWTLTFRMAMACIAFTGQILIAKAIFNNNYLYRNWFHLLSSLFFSLAYYSIRPSSESLSFYTLIIGWCLYLIKVSPLPNKKNISFSLLSIFLICLSIQIRYQMAFIVGPLFVWLLFKTHKKLAITLYFFAIGLLQTILCILLDSYSYNNYYTFSAWNYFDANITRKISAEFGVHSIYEYFNSLLQETYGIFLILFLVLLIKKQPLHWLVFFTLPYLFIHHLIGHKELRFLIPIILLFIAYTLVVVQSYAPVLKKIPLKFPKLGLLIIVIGLTIDFSLNLTKQIFTYSFFRAQVNHHVPKKSIVYDLYGDPYNISLPQSHGLGGILKNNFIIQNSIEVLPQTIDRSEDQKGYWIVRDYAKTNELKNRLTHYKSCDLIYQQPGDHQLLFSILNFLHYTDSYYLFDCNKKSD